METSQRFAIGIEYDGSRFCGWQSQKSRCSVQDHLEDALTRIAGKRRSCLRGRAHRCRRACYRAGGPLRFLGQAAALGVGSRGQFAAAGFGRRPLGAPGSAGVPRPPFRALEAVPLCAAQPGAASRDLFRLCGLAPCSAGHRANAHRRSAAGRRKGLQRVPGRFVPIQDGRNGI